MMKINKDTVMVKIKGFTQASYSGISAHGLVLVSKSESDMDGTSASELDEKHSETEGKIGFSEETLEQFFNEGKENLSKNNEYFDQITSLVIERIEDLEYNSFEEMNKALSNLSTIEKLSVKLTDDLVVENLKFTKDYVLLQFRINVENLNNFKF